MSEEGSLASEENPLSKYRLRGVIIHSGQATGGHYYSYICVRNSEDPRLGKWFKFDDGDVSEVDLYSDEDLRINCFGGDNQKDFMVDPYMKR